MIVLTRVYEYECAYVCMCQRLMYGVFFFFSLSLSSCSTDGSTEPLNKTQQNYYIVLSGNRRCAYLRSPYLLLWHMWGLVLSICDTFNIKSDEHVFQANDYYSFILHIHFVLYYIFLVFLPIGADAAVVITVAIVKLYSTHILYSLFGPLNVLSIFNKCITCCTTLHIPHVAKRKGHSFNPWFIQRCFSVKVVWCSCVHFVSHIRDNGYADFIIIIAFVSIIVNGCMHQIHSTALYYYYYLLWWHWRVFMCWTI